MKKENIILVIIIVIVILCIGGYFAYQKYFIPKTQTVSSQTAPQTVSNQTAGLETYTDNQNGFSIKYASSLKLQTSLPVVGTEQINYSPTAEKLLSISSGPETLTISVSPDPRDVGSCMVSQAMGSKPASTVKINGVSFLTYGTGDAGMGHWTSDTIYHTIRSNACWTIAIEVKGSNPGMADDPTAAADAQNKILAAAAALIDPIVQTFQFIGSTTAIAPPTCTLSADKVDYSLGDVINLKWSTQGANRAFWYQPLETGGIRKNIVPPQGIPGLSGKAVTVANIQLTYEPITMQVAGPGGFGTCSAYVSVKNSSAQPSITIDSGTILLNPNTVGNSDVVLKGTVTNGALYNDDINLVLFNANYFGPFDEATIYSNAFNQVRGTEWLSGGAAIELRQDNVPFENWSVKTYAPAGTTTVRVLAYPFYSSSTTSPTQPIANVIIKLTPVQ